MQCKMLFANFDTAQAVTEWPKGGDVQEGYYMLALLSLTSV